MRPVQLSICIVTYQSKHDLDSLLESLYSAELPFEYEVLVVDNASEDGLGTHVRKKHPTLNLIENSKNLFYAAAQNQNLRRACGRFVLSINPDTRVFADTVQRLVEYLHNHPEVAAVCPRFLKPDGTLRPAIGRFLTLKWGIFEACGINSIAPENRENRLIMSSHICYEPDKIQDAEVLYGACILTRHEVLDAVGALDENLLHGWDEYDWCKRVSDAGYKLCYVPSAKVIHVEGASRKNLKNDLLLSQFHRQGMLYLYRKHYGTAVFLALSFADRLVRPLLLKLARSLRFSRWA